MYTTWSDRMWPTSWARTTRCSPGPSRRTDRESMTTIGLPARSPARPETPQVTYRSVGHVEDLADAEVGGPHVGQLVLADAHRVGQERWRGRARNPTRSACAPPCRAWGPPSARRWRRGRLDARRPSRRSPVRIDRVWKRVGHGELGCYPLSGRRVEIIVRHASRDGDDWLPGRVYDAEACWYDVDRWTRVGGWPGRGDRGPGRLAQGGCRGDLGVHPAGRGTVRERVTEYEPRSGQRSDVDDESISGRQTVTFQPQADGVQIQLALDYALKRRSPVSWLVDLVFIRRLMGASLGRTLERFQAVLSASPPGAFNSPGMFVFKAAVVGAGRWAAKSRRHRQADIPVEIKDVDGVVRAEGPRRRARCGRRGLTPARSAGTEQAAQALPDRRHDRIRACLATSTS